MNFLITGATGFIGSKLSEILIGEGHHVYAVSRSSEKLEDTEQITYISYDVNPEELPRIHGIVNLAGESLFGYWSNAKKHAIKESRIKTTKKVVQLIDKLNHRPDVFINGSAVGFYGTGERTIFTEDSVRPGQDFLSSVTNEWENTASTVENLGIRTVYARFGIVLGKKDGAYPLMALPVKLFVGGRIGDGEQWISWVHVEDAVRLLHYCLFNEDLHGPVNITAPEPKRNKDFYKEMAKTYRRPLWLPIPARMMRLMLGDMASLITKGQYVYPQKAETHGFSYRYPRLTQALKQL
jgi:hypothetical protein